MAKGIETPREFRRASLKNYRGARDRRIEKTLDADFWVTLNQKRWLWRKRSARKFHWGPKAAESGGVPHTLPETLREHVRRTRNLAIRLFNCHQRTKGVTNIM